MDQSRIRQHYYHPNFFPDIQPEMIRSSKVNKYS